MDVLTSPWLLAGLVAYAVLAALLKRPYRWLGYGAIFLLLGTAVLAAQGNEALAEPVAQASYSWFVAFAVGLIIDTIRSPKTHD